jgi:protein-disulfide isomerase
MFCIVAFVVLSILGIFSAANRTLAKEALDCVFRRFTLRPCNTGFDEKMKAKILGSLITRSETAARIINKNFELLSWTFFLLMLVSSIWSVRGLYLFYTTGSCNGLNQAAFCVFDPTGANNEVSSVSSTCKVHPPTVKDLSTKPVDLSLFPELNPGASDKIVFVGCYSCDYTRKTYPLIRKLVDHFKVNFYFLHYPVKETTDYTSRVGYCTYQADPAKYWQLNDILFSTDKANVVSEDFIQQTFTSLGMDAAALKTCIDDPKTEAAVQKQLADVTKTKFYGTPTVFINDQVLVGPKPYRVYAILLKGLFYWLK